MADQPPRTLSDSLRRLDGAVSPEVAGIVRDVAAIVAPAYKAGAIAVVAALTSQLLADEQAGLAIDQQRVLAALHHVEQTIVTAPVPEMYR